MAELRRRFWQFLHDRLEAAWHWVYYHKLAEPLPVITRQSYQYNITYVCGKTGVMTDPTPAPKKEDLNG